MKTVAHAAWIRSFAVLAASTVLTSEAATIAVASTSAGAIARQDRGDTGFEEAFVAAIRSSTSTYDEYVAKEAEILSAAFKASHARLVKSGAITACPDVDSWLQFAMSPEWREGFTKEDLAINKNPAATSCTDPILRYFLGRNIKGSEVPTSALPHLQAALAFAISPNAREMDPFARLSMLAMCRLWISQINGRTPAGDLDDASQRAMLDALADLVRSEGTLKPDSRTPRSDAWWRGRLAFRQTYVVLQTLSTLRGPDVTAKDVEALVAIDGIDPWFREGLRTWLAMDSASSARGTKWAARTSDEQFRRGREFAAQAPEHAAKAWAVDPTRPEVPTLVVGAMLYGDGVNAAAPWFLKAVSASADWLYAYNGMATLLSPRWGGSAEELKDFALTCVRHSSPDSTVPYLLVNVARSLIRDGVPPSSLANDPTFGPALAKAMDDSVRAQIRKRARSGIASEAAAAMAIAIYRGDIAEAARYRELAPYLDTTTLGEFQLAERDVNEALTLFGPDMPNPAVRDQALAAEREGRWADAKKLWIDALKKPGRDVPDAPMALARAVAGRGIRCEAAAKLVAGEKVNVASIVGKEILAPAACIVAADGNAMVLTSDVQGLADGSISPFLASLALPMTDEWTFQAKLDLASLPRGNSEAAIGLAIDVGRERYPAHAAVAVVPSTGTLELLTSDDFRGEPPVRVDVRKYLETKSTTVTMRLTRRGNALTVELAPGATFETVWSGEIPASLKPLRGGSGVGLWARVPTGEKAKWHDVSLRRGSGS